MHVVSNVLKLDRCSLPMLLYLSDIGAICNIWPQLTPWPGLPQPLLTKITAIHSIRHGLHTYCTAQADSAFQPLWGGKWVSASWRCSAYSSLQADSKVKFACRLAYELAATWRWPTFVQMTQSGLSHVTLPLMMDDKINIIQVLLHFYHGKPLVGQKIPKENRLFVTINMMVCYLS